MSDGRVSERDPGFFRATQMSPRLAGLGELGSCCHVRPVPFPSTPSLPAGRHLEEYMEAVRGVDERICSCSSWKT